MRRLQIYSSFSNVCHRRKLLSMHPDTRVDTYVPNNISKIAKQVSLAGILAHASMFTKRLA